MKKHQERGFAAGGEHPGSNRSRLANRVCGVLEGTRLLTPTGYQAVETLRRGNLVATMIGRGPTFVPIVWVGRRKMQLRPHDDPRDVCPVRIRRHAVADNMPDSDLFLAPDHAIFFDGRLFATKLLINNATIVSETHRGMAEYWAVQVERHDLLSAQNLPIESLLPVNAEPFSEVRAPFLAIVGAKGTKNPDPPTEFPNFPASMLMTPRWFRRRFRARPAETVIAISPPSPPLCPTLPDGVLDVATEARAVLEGLLGLAQLRSIGLELAVEPELTVRMDRSAFRDILAGLLMHALYAGRVQRVLVGAMQRTGRVQVAVVTDGSGLSGEAETHALQPIRHTVSVHGGTLEIDTRPNEGSTLLLRLPA